MNWEHGSIPGTAKTSGRVLEDWNSAGQRESNQVLSSADCTLDVIPGVHGTPKHCLRGLTAKAVPGSMLAAKRRAWVHTHSLHYEAAEFTAISICF